MRDERTHRVIRSAQIAKLNGRKHFKLHLENAPERLPDEMLDWPELESLELENFTGPMIDLVRLTGLRKLTILGRTISPDLAAATQIRELTVCSGLLKALPELSSLTFLDRLTIECYSCLETFPDLSQLDKLTYLSLIAHSLKELPDSFGGLSALRQCSLQVCGLDHLPSGFDHLRCLEELHLHLGPAKLPDPVIGCIPSLKRLLIGLDGPNSRECSPEFELPESFAGLTGLCELAVDQRLLRVPDIIFGLESLERLALRGIREMPKEIGRLAHLQDLSLMSCQLTRLPEELAACTDLRRCDLSLNRLTEVPAWLLQLPALEELDLEFNPISSLPDFSSGNNLRTLLINGPIACLPQSIAHCTALEWLELSRTNLEQLPAELSMLSRLKKLELRDNSKLLQRPAVLDALPPSVKLETHNNAYQSPQADNAQTDDEQSDEEQLTEDGASAIAHHRKAHRWIHGIAVQGSSITLDVEAVLPTSDYPYSEREDWMLSLDDGALAFDRVTSPMKRPYDCSYHREYFTNSAENIPVGNENRTRISLYLHGEGRSAEIFLPGDENCIESPVGALPRCHSYGSACIDVLAVSEDEIYMTAQLKWIERVHILLRGSARGRVWRIIAQRRHQMFSSLAYSRGSVLASVRGPLAGIYSIEDGRLQPVIFGVDAPLIVVADDRLIFGGGESSAIFTARGREIESGWNLNFIASVATPSASCDSDESEVWAVEQLKSEGFLTPVDEPGPSGRQEESVETLEAWRRAVAACDAKEFADAATATDELVKEYPSPLIWRLRADCCARADRFADAIESCEAVLRTQPLDTKILALKVKLLERSGADLATTEAARTALYDAGYLATTVVFADTWLDLHSNFGSVEDRLREALAVRPDCAPLLRSTALLRMLQDRIEEAEALCVRAAALDPDSDQMKQSFALLAQVRGDARAAWRWYGQLSAEFLRQTPVAAFNLFALGPTNDSFGRETVRAMTSILREAPEYSPAYNNRAYSLYLCGERTVARRDAGLAVLFDKRNGPAWLTKASLDLAAGEIEAARASIECALEAGILPAEIIAEKELEPLFTELSS
jgi:Leucine-rich repeat (LRR) protein/tetratricopeptide (TPR) repeat protein